MSTGRVLAPLLLCVAPQALPAGPPGSAGSALLPLLAGDSEDVDFSDRRHCRAWVYAGGQAAGSPIGVIFEGSGFRFRTASHLYKSYIVARHFEHGSYRFDTSGTGAAGNGSVVTGEITASGDPVACATRGCEARSAVLDQSEGPIAGHAAAVVERMPITVVDECPGYEKGGLYFHPSLLDSLWHWFVESK